MSRRMLERLGEAPYRAVTLLPYQIRVRLQLPFQWLPQCNIINLNSRQQREINGRKYNFQMVQLQLMLYWRNQVNRTCEFRWKLMNLGELTKFVTIFGHSHYTQPWRIWTVNFTSLHQDCNQSSDYEMWKYAECNNNNVLGMNVAIRRRKENVECFNGETFKRTFENSSCSDCRLDVS